MRQIANKHRNQHAGLLKTEAMMSLFLLLLAINIASPLFHRINRLNVDAQQYQFAINELSNQIDAVARLTPEQAAEELKSLSPSPACEKTLGDTTLVGELSKDELGTRVTLSLVWEDLDESNPLQLSAWLVSDGEEDEVTE